MRQPAEEYFLEAFVEAILNRDHTFPVPGAPVQARVPATDAIHRMPRR